jgi:hypothetical protein
MFEFRKQQLMNLQFSLLLVVMVLLLLLLRNIGTVGANSPKSSLEPEVVPSILNYQGIVYVDGKPFVGPTGYFKFAIVDSATSNGTTNYWANDNTASGEPVAHVSLVVNTGLFNVLLGDTSLTGMSQPIDGMVFEHDPTYLRVWFSQTGTPGTFEAMEPNQRIASVAYALHAMYAENCPTDPQILCGYNQTCSMGIELYVSGSDHAIHGETNAVGYYGLWGVNSTTSETTWSYGVRGDSYSTLGRGVYGWAGASSGETIGIRGYSASFDGYGVYGISNHYGVYGYTQDASDGYGVVALTPGQSVIDWSSGWDNGIYGAGDIGVAGITYTDGGIAIYASDESAGGGSAGRFWGDVEVNGTLNKSAGSFKIDHPLDPENKYLYHSFVESPDMMNVYNGNVVLDADGVAWIELPDYFETLNNDFRYQLTPIEAAMPNLYVAEEVSDNSFMISGGQPGGKVSWQVTGIRQDPYAEANRIPVEEEKPAEEKGTYLHPELYGKSQTMALDNQLYCGDPSGSEPRAPSLEQTEPEDSVPGREK